MATLKRLLPTLLLILVLAACGAPQTEPAPSSTPPTHALLSPTNPPAEQPTPAPTPTSSIANTLDAQTTFAVISAVHEYVRMIDEWLEADVSAFERQAILYPQLEFGMGALEEVFRGYLPHPELESLWEMAESVFSMFAPLSLGWASGEIQIEEFEPQLSAFVFRIVEIKGMAALTAEGLGADVDLPDPIQSVYDLLPDPVVADPLLVDPEDSTPPSLNTELVPVQVTPFIYPFAGMEIFIVIGLVENSGSQAQEAVTVSIRFYNFLDEHLGTSTGQILIGTLLPGGTAPFLATTVTEGEEAALKDWTRYQVEIASRPAEVAGSQLFAMALSSAEIGGNGRTQIRGELTETGGKTTPVSAVRIAVAAFDAAGILVGVGEGFVPGEGELGSGGTTAFQAVIEAVSAEPVTFQFFAEVVE